jgi:hypothetical protein
MEVRHLRLLDVTPTRPGEQPFVAAASGLCELGNRLYVVADDEHTLASFPAEGNSPGLRHSLLRAAAQDHAPLPKAKKPDLEALCALADGTLLALPSGSSPARRLGAAIEIAGPQVRLIDFSPLFERLAKETDDLNLEGAAVLGDSLWLAQRGNNATPNALFEIASSALGANEVPASAFRRAVPLQLGSIEGIPLTPTDLCALPDGRLVLSAVCEDTSNSYEDGACRAAAIAVIQPGEAPVRVEQLAPTYKVEGLIARPAARGLLLWMVCDADDPTRPSPLLEGVLG